MKTIIALSGSLRKNSVNTFLLQEAAKLAPSGVEILIASIENIPLYNWDLEDKHGIPDAVVQLKEKIELSSGLLISTPEFNHGIPGVLKNTIDWLSRPAADIPKVFGNRPTGVIGAAAGHFGSALAQAAWLPILQCLNAKAYFGKSLHVGSSYSVFDESGTITDSKVQKRLLEYVEGFVKFATKSS
ncbi:MAG: NAD(P)H-dependent FMN reductase [Chlamydiae bacterium]|nr:NAD(P)H-dependent FMN reductase [Chlamydiota bacterium]